VTATWPASAWARSSTPPTGARKFTTIFVNNAIYGMTGGQMAPTTMPDQRTSTSPFGRKVEEVGMPIKVAELLAALQTPAYITRQIGDQAQIYQ
jgi:pyruvate/2-oxoacid:ferredoxin oxidoreductase beta subunit